MSRSIARNSMQVEAGGIITQIHAILQVEDNEPNREIAHDILAEYGFAVDTAEDGIIAVDKVARSEAGYYDLVLMDI